MSSVLQLSSLQEWIIMNYVTLDNESHYFNKMIYQLDRVASRLRVCALCRKPLLKGEGIYLIVNNNKVFPNIIVHKECSDKLGMMKTVKVLRRDYQIACFFRHWFY